MKTLIGFMILGSVVLSLVSFYYMASTDTPNHYDTAAGTAMASNFLLWSGVALGLLAAAAEEKQ